MAKRMTGTEKWDKEWFMNLSPKLKCLWMYINDKCDQAGMWEVNYKLATMHIGEAILERDVLAFGDRVEKFAPGKVWIVDHVEFQCGRLSEKCLAHKPVLNLLKKYRLLSRVLDRLPSSLKEKEKEIEEEKELEKEKEKSETLTDLEDWTEQVIKQNDPGFSVLVKNRGLFLNGQLEQYARDHLALAARYNWHEKITTQQAFRHSLIEYITKSNKTAEIGKHKPTLKEIENAGK